jgi:hypothetical protein
MLSEYQIRIKLLEVKDTLQRLCNKETLNLELSCEEYEAMDTLDSDRALLLEILEE